MGYGGSRRNAAEQLGRTGDGGVDGVINENRLGLDRVYVQAKRFKEKSVGRPDVQAFVGSLVGLGANKGVFVTTSAFSQQASEFARRLSQRVILIDGQRLAELMIEHNVGVRVNRSIQFKRIDAALSASRDPRVTLSIRRSNRADSKFRSHLWRARLLQIGGHDAREEIFRPRHRRTYSSR